MKPPADRKREHDKLAESVDRQAERLQRSQRERNTLLAQTRYLGTIGILLVLPIIAGAYLGQWLDSLQAGYTVRWTVSLIFLGVVIGGINVYLFIRD